MTLLRSCRASEGRPSPGQRAYAADLAIQPNHWDGSPRPAWATLGRAQQATWERNPTVKPRGLWKADA